MCACFQNVLETILCRRLDPPIASETVKFLVCLFVCFFVFICWFTGNDPANEETPNTTQANFKGTNSLVSLPKNTQVNLLLNVWGMNPVVVFCLFVCLFVFFWVFFAAAFYFYKKIKTLKM